MPKVSVIIPVYNTEKYLRRCLESVCNQTLKDIEIICINDCSPDNSLSILQEFAKNDTRVKVIDFTENKGVSVARNTGIDIAQGEYIGFVDSDDYIDLDFYEKLYKTGIQDGTDIIKGEMRGYDNINKNSYNLNFYDINKKIKRNPIHFLYGFTTAIYKLSLLKDNDIKFPGNLITLEDPCFSIEIILNTKKISIVDKVYYNYCNNEQSITRNWSLQKTLPSVIEASEIIVHHLNEKCTCKEDYLIIASFIFKTLFEYCENVTATKKNIQDTSKAWFSFYEKVQFKQELIEIYYINKMLERNSHIVSNLRKRIKK